MAEQRASEGPGIADLLVNGRRHRILVNPGLSLADTLRDHCGLTGTKVGCGAGDCGACTVLVDGAAICACLMPVAQALGRTIETIEGLATAGDPTTARLRASLLHHGAAQCGICTPGMMMAATALLRQVAAPSRAEIEGVLGGVLCRCTGYVKIVDAVAAVAARTDAIAAGAAPAAPSAGPAVGRSLLKHSGEAALDGTLRFGADWAPADALFLRIVRSPYAAARFTLGDLEAFRARWPGLAAVLTAADVPGENAFGIFPTTKDQPVLAAGLVRFRGEAVLALVGDRDTLAAIDGTDIPITWSPFEPVTGIDAALAEGAPRLHAAAAGNVLARGHLKSGDVDRGHAGAAATSEGTFETAFVEHAYIEPEAGYAEILPGEPRRILIGACTQAPYMDREEVARVLAIPEDRVIIQPTACGGGFGGKLDVSVQPLLAIAAWRLGRPVRLIYGRSESMASTTKRHPSLIRARASAAADGRLIAYEMTGDFNTGAYASWGPTVANRVPIHASGPYRVANVWCRTRAIYTNETPSGAFRGFGVPQAAIAHEALMDDLAGKLGIDRLAIRRLNAIAVGDRTPSGQLLTASAGLPACLEALRPAWEQALAATEKHNAARPRRRRGVGIGCMWYGCGNTSMSNPSAMRIALERDGRVVLWSGAVDIGQGSDTIMRQIAADALQTDYEVVTLGGHGDGRAAPTTAEALDAGKTSASRQTLVSGNAARRAAEALRAELLRHTNAGPGARLVLHRDEPFGRLVVIEDGAERQLDLARLEPFASGGECIEAVGTYDPPTSRLDAEGQGTPYATYGFGAQVAEVEVDLELATTRVLHIHAAHDVGRAINPCQVEGQIHGGIAQGLGLALMEEYVPGRTENLHDYLIPTVGDMPAVTVHLIEDPEPEGPFGAKGVGEPALIATAPAILGAIRHATGVVIRRVPVLPHRLLAALKAREGRG
jgi:CO/xanthine dehydrogenase Mo-binding subunit/aerobic-type carbon monoxide dehydrogenase small subunit (CoxS/CutS family)